MASDFRLWTPVANALEAYKRRVLRDPRASYEHVWRLVHIHEALIVTLGVALASRLLHEWQNSVESAPRLNRLRSLMTGIRESEADEEGMESGSPGECCLGGSIQAWINLLQLFGKPDTIPSCNFCSSLSRYLSEEHPNTEIGFLGAWRRIGPVPGAYTGVLSRVKRFEVINSLRNKLAHVPLPEKVLTELHKGLRAEVFCALSSEYDPSSDEPLKDFRTTKWHPPLRGRILCGDFFVTGSDASRCPESARNEDCSIRIQPQPSDDQPPDDWRAELFFHLDGECKVSLLFRIPDLRTAEADLLSGPLQAEYHRFAAEVEPVRGVTISPEVLEPWIPRPMSAAVVSPEQVPVACEATPAISVSDSVMVDNGIRPVRDSAYELSGSESEDRLRAVAEEAFRHRRWDVAVKFFDELAKRPQAYNYNHVAKSKHGGALWRLAVQAREASAEQKANMIRRAVGLLEEAANHRDPRYQARASYEKSKAFFHLWQLSGQSNDFEKAKVAAETAAGLDYEVQYITWMERLQAEGKTGLQITRVALG